MIFDVIPIPVAIYFLIGLHIICWLYFDDWYMKRKGEVEETTHNFNVLIGIGWGFLLIIGLYRLGERCIEILIEKWEER